MKMLSAGIVSTLCLLSAQCLLAQTPDTSTPPKDLQLVQIDTTSVLPKGGYALKAAVRFFGAKESITYSGLAAHVGLGSGLEALVRGDLAPTKGFALTGGGGTIHHGGDDAEIAARYAPRGLPWLAGQVGVGFAKTPAQSGTYPTAGLMADANIGSYATLYLNPRAIFIKDNTIVGIGVGVRARIVPNISLVGDWTPIINGDNTRDTGTGQMIRSDVYGAALRYSSVVGESAISLDLGFTNGTGVTTGFGLTPGLGGSGAFYFAFSVKR